jgi:hypothetical protein
MRLRKSAHAPLLRLALASLTITFDLLGSAPESTYSKEQRARQSDVSSSSALQQVRSVGAAAQLPVSLTEEVSRSNLVRIDESIGDEQAEDLLDRLRHY